MTPCLTPSWSSMTLSQHHLPYLLALVSSPVTTFHSSHILAPDVSLFLPRFLLSCRVASVILGSHSKHISFSLAGLFLHREQSSHPLHFRAPLPRLQPRPCLHQTMPLFWNIHNCSCATNSHPSSSSHQCFHTLTRIYNFSFPLFLSTFPYYFHFLFYPSSNT